MIRSLTLLWSHKCQLCMFKNHLTTVTQGHSVFWEQVLFHQETDLITRMPLGFLTIRKKDHVLYTMADHALSLPMGLFTMIETFMLLSWAASFKYQGTWDVKMGVSRGGSYAPDKLFSRDLKPPFPQIKVDGAGGKVLRNAASLTFLCPFPG